MRLLSVNVGRPRVVSRDGEFVITAIFKEPVDGRMMLSRLNLEGDGQADLRNHGGADKAVYAYPFEHYAHWQQELGRDDFIHGQFGENFTVAGLLETEVNIGDVFGIGSARLQVTQPRIPCFKLNLRMGMEDFDKKFLSSNRIGFYLRVLEAGEVGAGDAIERLERDAGGLTVAEVCRLAYVDTDDLDGARRALAVEALSAEFRLKLERRLAREEKAVDAPDGDRILVVDKRVRESDTITSFYLVAEDGAPLAPFRPGQFLPLSLDIPDRPKPVIRTYTLSNAPGGRGRHYRLSIKREPAPAHPPDAPPGLSSNYFHDRVEPGTRLRTRAPRGDFHLDPGAETAVVLLSGGVGLTPMISMLDAIVDAGVGRPVWFIHGARNGNEHAMGEHVRRMARENANVNVHISYSRPASGDVPGRDYDREGRIDAGLLGELLSGNDFEFYLCGPTPFMKSVYGDLRDRGVPETRIHHEFFGPATALREDEEPAAAEPGPAAALDGAADGPEVTFLRSGVTAVWDPALGSLLDLAEAHGISPDFSCRSGICHTCLCTIFDGAVDYTAEPMDDPGEGNVLICCSTPKGNVVLDV